MMGDDKHGRHRMPFSGVEGIWGRGSSPGEDSWMYLKFSVAICNS